MSNTRAGPFKIRGREVSRLEALTDGVFAVAMTLLIVSVEVPSSFQELMNVVRGFPAFAICFATMIWIWLCHYHFCRRYGLSDGFTVFLNCVLLFIVLFYVYPLKFLFSAFVSMMTGLGAGQGVMRFSDVPDLFVLYGVGFGSVFLVLALMHIHALRHAGDLTDLERRLTRFFIARFAIVVAIACTSILIALTVQGGAVQLAGWVYSLIGLSEGIFGFRQGKLIEAAQKATPPAAPGRELEPA